jgi:HEAT repeat protein
MFAGTPQSLRARSLSAPMAGLRAPSRGTAKAEEPAAMSLFYGRGYAGLRDVKKDGLALLPGNEESYEYLQEGVKSLHDKDQALYHTLNQIYYAQSTNEITANQTLGKLLSSKEEAEMALGLNVLAILAQQEIKIDEAFVTKATKLATEGKNEHIRSQALWAVCAVEKPVPLDILNKTARDEDAGVRLITAYALADKKLGKKAERLIARLVSDEDQRVAALAIKAGTEARKMNRLIPAMSDILLNADSEKHYLAILEAGLGLGRLAEAEQKVKTRVQKVFVKALNKDYPASVGKEKLNLRRAISLVALKTLAGYKGQDVYPQVLKLASDSDKDVQTMAVSTLARYKKAASYLLDNVLAKESFLDRSELLANVVQHLRKYEPEDDFYLTVRRLLENDKTAGPSHGILRVALVEALLDGGNSKDIQYVISLLRKDSYWKVRRAILARLAGIKNKEVLTTALSALEDPHPVIKQLALAEAVAATAKKDRRVAYLDKLSQDPTPAICDEILVAEGLSSDLSVRPLKELRSIVAARTTELR